ncbi:Ras family [Plasmodiophora brassicae]|uniref:Uncharacterized protein n=1 Tax=Plasmodiophora brassicae TaxID=37360 RepID=A0A0G4ITY7_PLABS|nr:hypothetical protein PBRA_006796 [Plasmodiophora brassicae]SPR00817.1 unnamed protein product [Plasmodiophora brassicae]
MQEEEFDNLLKVIVVGNGQVGKTSMITKFATGDFTGQYKKTIGTDFMEREIQVPSKGASIKLMLWDTAGQEMFSEITRNYYRGAGAVVYAFSSVDRDSFEAIEKWRHRVLEECGDTIAEVLVQTKTDLISQAVMTPNETESLARKLNLKLYRICTKENKLVDEVFQYLSEQYLDKTAATGTSTNTTATKAPPTPSKAGSSREMPKSPVHDVSGQEATSPKDKFKLEPSRQRTGGRKDARCSIL